MKKSHMILTLALSLFVAGVLWAQGDETQQPSPPPVPAFGQENPAPTVAENPPISAIDQPGLEPHAAPESFLLTGLHFSESADSNVADGVAGSSIASVTRGLGSVTLQRLWKNYDLALDYVGGVGYYDYARLGLEQIEQLDLDNRITWKRGQLAIRDSFSYLPEGNFGLSAYGGEGAYNAGLGGMGAGLLGAGAFGQGSLLNGATSVLSPGIVPRITNLGLADIVEELSPRSAVTVATGYGFVHFLGNFVAENGEPIGFIGSREFITEAGYDHVLNPKDQLAVIYAYQAFDFSTLGTALHTNVLQAMYGHRISGRMDMVVSAGPQFTHIGVNETICTLFGVVPVNVPLSDCTADGYTPTPEFAAGNHLGVAGRFSLRYRFPKTYVSFSFQRFDTSGDGIFAGSLSEEAHVDIQRKLGRVWDMFSDYGYARNKRLQIPGTELNATVYSYGFGGIGLHRHFGRSLQAFVSYQFNEAGFNNSCPVPGTSGVACSHLSQRQVGSIGLDWILRPIRLD